MDDGAGVRARAHHLGVDWPFDVPLAVAGEHLAVEADEDDSLRGDLLEPERRRLHRHAASVRVAG